MPNSMTAALMVGEVQEVRPRVSRDQVLRDINAAIRLAIGQRPFWSDLLTRGIISIPNAYTTGTASLAPGSATVAGTGTSWPINDAVNTTLDQAVRAYGGDYCEIKPSQMSGIQVGTMLYIGGAFPEAAAVVEVTRESCYVKLQNPHDATSPITSSSLAGRQFRLGTSSPIFTVRAVVDAATLLLDNPWGGAAASGSQYRIYQAYYSIDADFRDWIAVKDEQQGWPIRTAINVQLLDVSDPQRSSSGDPRCIADHSPNEAGVMQFEIWPHQTAARQLSVLYAKGWPDLKRDMDRPPWFIDPSVFIGAAKAKALMMKKPVPIGGKLQDPYYDPQAAQAYAAESMAALQAAINADESRALRALEANWAQIGLPGNAAYWQSHDADLNSWSL